MAMATSMTNRSDGRGKLLFTPGPLTTSRVVKEAMLQDLGSRDTAFIDTVRRIRHRLLELGGVSQEGGYEAILMQGSGTFGLEAVVSSTVPRGGRLLVVVNGAYGERIVKMTGVLGVDTRVLRYAENTPFDVEEIRRVLAEDPAITNVSAVHCETTTGLLNPIEELGAVVREAGRYFFVDAMSSFGAIPLDVEAAGIDFMVTSANKCLEGVPGFSIILARREALLATEGAARTLSLDVQAQWRGLEANGQFRFTPPTHTILALEQALQELAEEGGIAGRAARYRANHAALTAGMRRLGFRVYLRPEHQGYIISSFHYPDDPNFSFEAFYEHLNEKGLVIYPGKLTHANCFRIGNIGRVFTPDIERLVAAIEQTLSEMDVSLAATSTASSA